uniref:Uncharacterized protein n=1 Tax=Oryza punctata TaxID=4537 RepID=A0A0E0KIL5_ORYPU
MSEEYIRLRKPLALPDPQCFTYKYYLFDFWANYNDTRDALGIRKGTVSRWIRCAHKLPYVYDVPSSIEYHHNITNKGYRVLVYSGDHDIIMPFLSTHAWIRSFNYPIVDDWRAWHLDGQAGAGHNPVEYVPKQGFAMA